MTTLTSGSGSYRLALTLLHQAQAEDCLQCRDALEDYCLAQLADDKEQLAAYTTTIALHLDSCVACAECYELLYTALLADASEPEPASYPVPELSFLKPQARASDQLLLALSQACEHYGQHLRLTLSQALLGLLPPAPSLALRSAATQPIFDLRISWPERPIDGLHMQALSRSSGLVNLHVRIHQAGRQWPELLPARVVLTLGTERYQSQSDAFGEVVLMGIPSDKLDTAIVEVELI